jgi:hypothetical protein
MTMLILAICVRMCQINIYWGMGHGALGIGHWALGIGHWALGIGHGGDWGKIYCRLVSNAQCPALTAQMI